MSIASISNLHGALISADQLLDGGSDSAASIGGGATAGGASFAQTLESAFNNVNTLQNNAAQATTSFALGQASDIHDVMIAAQKASVALQLTTEVRNKIVDAYNSVMSMQM